MNIRTVQAKRILTRQKRGFLALGDIPFTHSLSWAAGCGFGNIYCGKYCYAAQLPNWLYNKADGEEWGDAIIIKENAPDLLEAELAKAQNRPEFRIFMSSVTDPYQPIERRYRLTRRCLDVFAQYDDLDLLVIQTRSPFVTDDIERLARIPYVVVSMTIETNRGDLAVGPNDKFIEQRFEAVRQVADAGIRTQITVAPCLPYTPDFAQRLAYSGAGRIVVDTFVAGDGTQGQRTASSPFAEQVNYNWRDEDPAKRLYHALQDYDISVGWSVQGFASIPPREGAAE
ncbi:MAG: radical SAM protein [Chloroflexi bacterium]|nr:radical SAM protein [Chloroflexota bacterium]